ncbi:MAG: LPD38 domain-containing protein, partial [Burkholderiaceae bacterium]
DGSLWAVDKPPTVRVLDPMTNTARTMVDPNYRNLPYVVMLRIGGKDAAITFNERNPEASRLAQSIKNLDVGDLHAAISLIAKGTRWFASINTQYNPIFGIINFARDLQSGLLNLSTTAIAGKEKEVAANVWPALKAIYRTERGGVSVASQDQPAAHWASRWQQLQAAGGTTGYRDLFADAKERADALARELAALDRGAASKAAHAVLDWLSDYNEAMENAVRLSAFDVALNSGLSQERAASLAKNLTVNFNRKGRQSREIGALYAFFNASIQGTARMAQTLKGPLGRKIMLGGVMLGAVNTLLAMAIMGGGDDGDDGWEKIPEFVKEKNLIIPISKTEYLSLPLPLGFHFLPNIGRLSVEMMAGGRDHTPGRQLGKLLQVLLDAFNPLGGTQSFSQLVTPTVADPAVALAQNQDWTGRPIYRGENHNPLNPQPGTALVKDSATPWSKVIAEALNRISGGTAYQPGAWSPTPDQIDYVIGQLTGGVGRELGKLAQTISAPFTGDELPAHKIPLLGRLYGSTQGVSGESELFYKNIKLLNQIENEYKWRMKAGEDAEGFRRQEPLVDQIGFGNQAEAAVSKLRRLRREEQLRADPSWQERAKAIDQQIEEVMRGVNQAVGR